MQYANQLTTNAYPIIAPRAVAATYSLLRDQLDCHRRLAEAQSYALMAMAKSENELSLILAKHIGTLKCLYDAEMPGRDEMLFRTRKMLREATSFVAQLEHVDVTEAE